MEVPLVPLFSLSLSFRFSAAKGCLGLHLAACA